MNARLLPAAAADKPRGMRRIVDIADRDRLPWRFFAAQRAMEAAG